jgi:hypothetical protein
LKGWSAVVSDSRAQWASRRRVGGHQLLRGARVRRRIFGMAGPAFKTGDHTSFFLTASRQRIQNLYLSCLFHCHRPRFFRPSRPHCCRLFRLSRAREPAVAMSTPWNGVVDGRSWDRGMPMSSSVDT